MGRLGPASSTTFTIVFNPSRHRQTPVVEPYAKQYAAQFPAINLFTIDDVARGWTKAQKGHFADGGLFDQIYQPGRK